jgi:RNA polymerase sigma factor (sigma-70 family)
MNFEEILKRLSPTIKRIAYKLKGYSPYINEEDLYQEAMSHLWVDYKEGKLSDKTDSYILQGCYFHLKNYLRKNKTRSLLLSLDGVVYDEEGQELRVDNILYWQDPHSALDEIHVKFFLEQINNNGLTKREKEVFYLALEGLTTREIGRRLGVSHVRVVKLQKKIREKCKEHLDIH